MTVCDVDGAWLLETGEMRYVNCREVVIGWMYVPDGNSTGGGTGGGDPNGCEKALIKAGKTVQGYLRALENMSSLLTATHGDQNWANLLAAVGIKESDFRNIPEKRGGKGRGVFQIDLGKNPSVSESQAQNIL